MKLTIYLILIGLVLSGCNTDNNSNPYNQNLDSKPENMPQIADSLQVRTIRIRKNGEGLFIQYCNNCHDIKRDMTGPALQDITKKHSRDWLYAFTKNSQGVIAAGDEYATALFKAWGSVMPPFPDLDSMQIMRIYDYIATESAK